MNSFMVTFFSMSVSGSLLICLLLLCKPFYKNRISKRWQYYIWLVVLARLLLPVTLQGSLVGNCFGQVKQMLSESGNYLISQMADGIENDFGELGSQIDDMALLGETEQVLSSENGIVAEGGSAFPSSRISEPEGVERRNPMMVIWQNLWLIWLAGVLFLLIRKITIYQSFVKYVKAGCREVSDVARLDQVARIGEQIGVRQPVELCTNSLISSPMILGFFHPCIVLPDTNLPEEDFQYTVRHELTHAKRHDMVYKWLVQATICLHWFNPLVYWMGKEINRLCELSLDERIICSLEKGQIRAYGDTLLHAMGAGVNDENFFTSKLSESKTLASLMLGEDAELLKERLGAMMDYKKYSKGIKLVSLAITFVLVAVAMAIGAYASPAQQSIDIASKEGNVSPAEQKEVFAPGGENAGYAAYAASYAEQCYQEKALTQFSICYKILGEEEQRVFLERSYEDGRINFFSVAIGYLTVDHPLVQTFAEKAYEDGAVNFFSVAMKRMSEELLEEWLARAVQDRRTSFQAMILNTTGKDKEADELEQELEMRRLEEYQKHGITKGEMAYYYNGQLVGILMDTRINNSFVVLDMNPQGTVNIHITRDESGEIETVSYMSKEEVEGLLGEDYGKTKDYASPEDIVRMVKENAPTKVQDIMENCGDGKWYTIEDGERCFIYFNGLSHNYAYQPRFEGGQINIGIFDVGKLEKTYVLLSVPRGRELTVIYNGQEVSLVKPK